LIGTAKIWISNVYVLKKPWWPRRGFKGFQNDRLALLPDPHAGRQMNRPRQTNGLNVALGGYGSRFHVEIITRFYGFAQAQKMREPE